MDYKKLFIKALILLKEISVNMSSGYNRRIYLKIKEFLNENSGLESSIDENSN